MSEKTCSVELTCEGGIFECQKYELEAKLQTAIDALSRIVYICEFHDEPNDYEKIQDTAQAVLKKLGVEE